MFLATLVYCLHILMWFIPYHSSQTFQINVKQLY